MDDPGPAAGPSHRHPPAARIPVRAISVAVVIAMALYVAMATLADWDAFARAVASVPGLLWAWVVLLSLASYLARFARWHRFLGALSHRIPVGRSLEIYLSAFALTLTPGKAGETVRSVYLRPLGVSYPESLGAFVSERLLDLAATGLLAASAALAFPGYGPWALGALACCIAAIVLFRSRLALRAVAGLLRGSLGDHATRGIRTIGYLLSGRRLAGAVPLSFLAWAAQGVSLWLIVDALGYGLSPLTVIGIYCLSILAGVASFIPGGLGATEAAIALLLAAAGLDRGDAITASLVTRGLTLWLAVGTGIVAMARIAATNPPGSPRGSAAP